MKNNRQIYYEIAELKKIYDSISPCHVIIWGTGEVSKEVAQTLLRFGIPVYAYGDNDKNRQRQIDGDMTVLDAASTAELPNPFVIIGSYVVKPIYEQLRAMGIIHIYAITDTIKYNIAEWEQDRRVLSSLQAFNSTFRDNILVEIYGNIGDVIIRLGIVDELVKVHGEANICFLVEQEGVAEILRIVAKEVLVIDRYNFITNDCYRKDLLTRLNGCHFTQNIILCDIRLHATRRLLSRYNFNGGQLYYHNIVPDQEYLPAMDMEFIRKCMEWQISGSFSPKHRIDLFIAHIGERLDLPERYAAVNMGATKEVRHYSPAKCGQVLGYIRSLGFEVLMIGCGEYDETFYKSLPQAVKEDPGVHNCIGKYSLLESLSAIQKADFFVGTDSGMWNASYILDKPSVVLYGGGEYGNFMHMDKNIYYAIAGKMECFGCRWFCTNRTNDGYAQCIDGISPEIIIEKIMKMLNDNGINR